MKCKICAKQTYKIVVKEKFYYRCTSCEYIFLDDRFILDAQDEKKHYDNHHNTLESSGYVEMFERLIDEFVADKNIKSAFDFGCGEGAVLATLLQRRKIECDKYDLYYFPKKGYKNKTYDMVLSTEVFEHLKNPLDVFKELLELVKEGGYLLVMSSFHPKDDEKFAKWYYIQDTTHIGFFSMFTFGYLAERFGVEIIKHNEKNVIMFRKSKGYFNV